MKQSNNGGSSFVRGDTATSDHPEELLRHVRRLETIATIAGQVAHDINNLLGPLVGYPELIKLRLPKDHPAVTFCDAIFRAAQQMADINEDLMTLVRRAHLSMEPTDLNRLVQQAVSQMPPTPSTLVIHVQGARDLLPINGAPSQLLRLIANLLANAREAMDDRGVLIVGTDNVHLDRPLGRYKRVEIGEYVRLTVTDTGCGVPLDIRERIFDPFFTTKASELRRGAGMGLSVVEAVVEDHRGYIDLASEVGEGTSFFVYLPAWREAPAPTSLRTV